MLLIVFFSVHNQRISVLSWLRFGDREYKTKREVTDMEFNVSAFFIICLLFYWPPTILGMRKKSAQLLRLCFDFYNNSNEFRHINK